MRDEAYKHLLGSRTWKTLRASYLQKHPLCEECEAAGRTVLATEVHHVIPIGSEKSLAGMRRLAYNYQNLRALCHDCHERIHREEFGYDKRKMVARQHEKAQAFMERWLSKGAGG